MISFLARFFIKNYKDYDNREVRLQYGVFCSAAGIFFNILLFAAKLFAGIIASSVAMVADALNNLSDAASSVISIIGFKLSGKKPDVEHPFGHGRIEYISGFVVSILILLMGFELLKTSVLNMKGGARIEQNMVSAVIMVISVFVKFYMYLYNKSIAKKIKSVSMEATAKDSLSDTISTFVVIFSMICARFTDFPVDCIAGIIVAGFILYTGFETAKETIDPLLGRNPSKELVKSIEEIVLAHEPINGIHDLLIHDYGPGRLIISLHAEVPGDHNIYELHEVIDDAEVELAEKLSCLAVIHMDPVDLKNERLQHLKSEIIAETQKIHPSLSVHDVRIVPGVTHTNLIFDVVKPYGCNTEDDEIKHILSENIKKQEPDINCVITVEPPFC